MAAPPLCVCIDVLDDSEFGAPRVFDNPDPVGQMVQLASLANGMSGHGAGMGAGMMMGSSSIMGGADGGGGAIGFMSEPWPGLAMSRVLGHTGVANLGIIPNPALHSFEMEGMRHTLLHISL